MSRASWAASASSGSARVDGWVGKKATTPLGRFTGCMRPGRHTNRSEASDGRVRALALIAKAVVRRRADSRRPSSTQCRGGDRAPINWLSRHGWLGGRSRVAGRLANRLTTFVAPRSRGPRTMPFRRAQIGIRHLRCHRTAEPEGFPEVPARRSSSRWCQWTRVQGWRAVIGQRTRQLMAQRRGVCNHRHLARWGSPPLAPGGFRQAPPLRAPRDETTPARHFGPGSLRLFRQVGPSD